MIENLLIYTIIYYDEERFLIDQHIISDCDHNNKKINRIMYLSFFVLSGEFQQ